MDDSDLERIKIRERLALRRAAFIVFGGAGLIGGSFIVYQIRGFEWLIPLLAFMSGIIALLLYFDHNKTVNELN